ncbi:hypothetical protein SNSL254_A4368 [Salmonella enterica subsp. enterica serovar Newport str. SL254]|uniref:Uncharacterized protein n=1 Tax=Salmonella newport (strain SL254) TaxID=423368 RepID=A0A0H3BY00_SALNS|nr:hypothetical protein SNSL254_A4368 [Salmonella enterica subsp. enterica serovar Newport str. SL254]AGS31616.1 hypothetical protein SN31241_46480 [Salmonella enterica subsp. enterica serovar Newport str. USMARC-S3124.1]OSJ44608.1 hypothetical protein K791_20235 [Salmonella enterica subsp. enterica serovar Newport str. SHSN001]
MDAGRSYGESPTLTSVPPGAGRVLLTGDFLRASAPSFHR